MLTVFDGVVVPPGRRRGFRNEIGAEDHQVADGGGLVKELPWIDEVFEDLKGDHRTPSTVGGPGFESPGEQVLAVRVPVPAVDSGIAKESGERSVAATPVEHRLVRSSGRGKHASDPLRAATKR